MFSNWAFLESILSKKPDAQIIRIVSHDKNLNGFIVPNYVDEFGLPIYIQSVIDWEGVLTDIDERFSGTDLTPNDL